MMTCLGAAEDNRPYGILLPALRHPDALIDKVTDVSLESGLLPHLSGGSRPRRTPGCPPNLQPAER